ncbi:MAG TPA: maltose ABC transporter substrate-binding protein [Actinomycetaceae bacterium]|nr:maltose ABC transporter substrate-binding protein [Actinomycetaceae bacterium]
MRRSIVITAAAALTLGLAACGGDASEEADTAAPEETTGGAAEETSEPAGDGGTLTIWVDDTREDAVRAAAETFEAETGATVELVQKNYDDIRPDFLAQVPTGEGPDITVGAHDWLGEFTANGVVAPIELGDVAADFEDVALEAFTYEGQVYGLPYAIENIALYRNTELVDQTPATFDEMIAAGEASGAEYPFLIQITENGDPYTMYPFQTSFGAPVFETNEDGSYIAELAMGGEAGTAFAQWLAEQGAAGNLNTSWEYDIVVEAFANGEAAFLVGGPWMLGEFGDVELAVDPIPSAGGEPAQPFTGVQGFYVSARSQNALLATDFLVNYMATEEAQIALYEAGDRTPALTSAADVVSEDPIAAGFREVGADAVPMPSIPEMGEVWNFWGVTEAQIISGAVDPVDGWEKMIADIEAAIGG